MLTLCMNPGKVHDWSLLECDIPIATSDYGTYDMKEETLDAFDALVELAKTDSLPYVGLLSGGMWIYNGDADLYFHANYNTEDELRAAFEKVVNFLKGY